MSNKNLKYIYFVVALTIVGLSLFFTRNLSRYMVDEERKKIEIWAKAMSLFNEITPSDSLSFNFIWNIIESNKTIPVIIADKKGVIINYVNIKKPSVDNSSFFLKKIEKFQKRNIPIELIINENEVQYIYYDKSTLLKYLEWFPYIQLSFIAFFLLIAFWAFTTNKKSEQNRVWVGLSKETAHQLGTPISSLMAWEEILKIQGVSSNIIFEIDKDISRLQKISDRFSKIGSTPILQEENIVLVIENTIEYLKKRTSNRVIYSLISPNKAINAPINTPLFEWVIENLCKNAVDAMSGEGNIVFYIEKTNNTISIDIKDTGKGISKKHFKEVFKPGFTTKQRGWGLGLSLSKRIIEDYHRGKIFVKSSELGKQTTFRIVIRS